MAILPAVKERAKDLNELAEGVLFLFALRPIAPDAAAQKHLDDGAKQRLKKLAERSEEHTSELQSLMRISYAVFCLKKKKNKTTIRYTKTKIINTQITMTTQTHTQNILKEQ